MHSEYHFVQCVKYRRNLLQIQKSWQLKRKKHRISETFEADVLNIEADKNHFHMIFQRNQRLIFHETSTH